MNRLFHQLALLVVLATTGCASVEISQPKSLKGIDILGATTKADRQVVVRCTGFHFVSATFLVGDLRWDEKKRDINGGFRWFYDCNTHDCYRVLQEVANRENSDLVDVILNESSSIGFNTTSYQGIFYALFGLYEVQVCGVLREKNMEVAE